MNRLFELTHEKDDYLDLAVLVTEWIDSSGQWRVEKDYNVDGERWRVHKSDADPFPSKPHAHCIAGKQRFIGTTLHLGTRERYRGRDGLGYFLHEKQFTQLIELIRPKFPGITLPLP